MLLGIWKNYDELEENLCLAELEAILKANRKKIEDERIFMAALKGIDLKSGPAESEFEEVQRRAQSRIQGVPQEQLILDEIGIGLEIE